MRKNGYLFICSLFFLTFNDLEWSVAADLWSPQSSAPESLLSRWPATGSKRLGLHLPRQLSESTCDEISQINIKRCKTWQSRTKLKRFFRKVLFFLASQSQRHHKALIAHQCLLTISKHRLDWIYRVTLDAHLYCSWREAGGAHLQKACSIFNAASLWTLYDNQTLKITGLRRVFIY